MLLFLVVHAPAPSLRNSAYADNFRSMAARGVPGRLVVLQVDPVSLNRSALLPTRSRAPVAPLDAACLAARFRAGRSVHLAIIGLPATLPESSSYSVLTRRKPKVSSWEPGGPEVRSADRAAHMW